MPFFAVGSGQYRNGRRFRSRNFHTPFLTGAGAGWRTYIASCPGVFSSGIRPRRSSGDGPISGIQTWRIREPAGDQEESSVGIPTSSSTVTAVSGSGGEAMGRRSVRIGETRRWRTSTVRKNYDDHLLPLGVVFWRPTDVYCSAYITKLAITKNGFKKIDHPLYILDLAP
ncbi:hypothetical protein EVAR_51124_1 [Eumeta japonica]|uniref:Uncharacterized protein n=1 Tax=Eumeta variegata TaxID=151549 RepID=A0A4C1YCL0_EUMVA|nr:hypothetical protein EVAR_51124_1 [Eumeta japonica]